MKIKSADDFREQAKWWHISTDEDFWNLLVRIRDDKRKTCPEFSFVNVHSLSNDELAPYIARYILEGSE